MKKIFLDAKVAEISYHIFYGHILRVDCIFLHDLPPASIIIEKPLMIQGVDGFAKQKEDKSIEKTHQMDLQRWNRPVHDDASEIVNIAVDGVEKEQRLYILRKSGNSVENRGKIHQIMNNQAVKILRIPKENMKRGKDISNSHIEEKQAENGITQTHPYDVRLNAVNQDNGEHNQHGQEEIYQAGDTLGNHEQLLINADSGKNSDIGGESEHGLIGGVGEIMIYDIADNQITDEMFAPPEKIITACVAN